MIESYNDELYTASRGSHADARLTQDPDGSARLVKRLAIGKLLGQQEAEFLQSHLSSYREDLHETGWILPALYDSQIVETDQEWQIETASEYISGMDLATLIRRHGIYNKVVRLAITSILQTLAQYDEGDLSVRQCFGTQFTGLPHGIDLQPSNIVVSHDNMTYFVDIFPPKEIDENGNFICYNQKVDVLPAESLLFLCATRQGAALRFLRKTYDLAPKINDDFTTEAARWLSANDFPATEVEEITDDVRLGFTLLESAYSHTS